MDSNSSYPGGKSKETQCSMSYQLTTGSIDNLIWCFLLMLYLKPALPFHYRYIFPGLALGAALGQTGVVTNAMINRSAEALVELISEEDLKKRATFPEGVDIREISCHLAAKVIMQAMDEGIKVSKIGSCLCI